MIAHPKRGTMELKDHDRTEWERRLGGAAMLVTTNFSVVALAAVAGCLIWHASAVQDRATRESEINFWRKIAQ